MRFVPALAAVLLGSSALAQTTCDAPLPALTGKVTLHARCLYRQQELRITQSDTTLDCNGSVFDGEGKSGNGITIDSQGQPLSHITVRNCTFKNYSSHGLLVGWGGPDGSKTGDRDSIYARTPSDIVIDHVVILNSGKVGLYVDDYVQRVLITNSQVSDSAKPGIYLEHSSRFITLRDNLINGNGHSNGREGLAIDSSANNVVEHNVFRANGGGSIFLYKNCHEHADTGIQSVERWQHSDNNLIRDNTFQNEKVGIWIASRQSRNLSAWGCGDPPMAGDKRFYRDYADNNTVQQNSFCAVAVPIRNAGDNNTLRDNRFDASIKLQVESPTTQRERLLHLPAVGNTITGSVTQACPQN